MGIYKKLLDNLNTATIWLDDKHLIVYANNATEALFEVSRKQMVGQPLSALRIAEGNTIEKLVRAATEEGDAAYTAREATIPLVNGSKLVVDVAVTPTENVEPQTLLVELQSIDRLMRISKEEDLLSRQSTSRKLIRGMAHEIKNPLGGIRGAAQLLSKLHSGVEDYTTVIIEEADRLRNLVDNMLGPNKALKKQPTNVHEVLDRVKQLIRAEGSNDINITCDYDPSIPEITGDKEQLIQATLNIARNAMQAMYEANISEPALHIKTRIVRQFTISEKRHRLVCAMNIIDNGPGVPQDMIEELFFPMVTGRAEGTGLGLSIAQSIAQRHHGLIACDSKPGHTCFTLYIPLEY